MIAIDPGKNGGIAIALTGQAVTTFHIPPTDGELLRKLELAKASGAITAYLEDIVLFTGVKIPSSSGIKYGASWGIIKGILLTLKFRIVLVRPQKWQKALGLGNSREKTK